jgi:hypothetical protein
MNRIKNKKKKFTKFKMDIKRDILALFADEPPEDAYLDSIVLLKDYKRKITKEKFEEIEKFIENIMDKKVPFTLSEDN